jgi:hypothetical protein
VGLFSRLFGKKEQTEPATAAPSRQCNPPTQDRPASAGTVSGPAPLAVEEENLRRWRESGQPRAWFEAHQGQWSHQDWLDLLDALQRSSFWPLQPDDVGRVLEDLKPPQAGNS